MADIPITEFGIRNVERAYGELKTQALMIAPLGLSMAVATWMICSQALRIIREERRAAEDPVNVWAIFKLLYLYGVVLMVALLMPVFLYYVEMILAELMDNAIIALGGEPKGAIDTLLSEMESMERRHPEGVSFFDSFNEVVSYIMTIWLKPVLALFIRYLFAMFLLFRYGFLLILELESPIMLAFSINENSKLLEKWVLNMVACYLMIPAFLIGIGLGNKAVVTLFGNPYSFLAIIIQFLFTLFLIKKMSDVVFKTL